MSTAYHPQTDGETERMNQEIEVYLRMFCANQPKTWKNFLSTVEFAHNQHMHSSVKHLPFYLMMGYEPKAIPTAYPKSDVPAAEKRIVALQKSREEALAAHELARQTMAERITRRFTPFEIGQKVWLDSRNLKISDVMKKLSPKRTGPFQIKKVLSPLSYELKLPNQWKIHPVFHTVLLTPYHETTAHGPNYLKPPPDLIEGEHKYKVESIITHK